NRQSDHLGVNKMGKNIKKSPIHQPSFSGSMKPQTPPQPQPQVYNIDKNDFRDLVQQLTGSPLRDPSSRPPPQNHPRPVNNRLQRVRPPPLVPTNRPQPPHLPVHRYPSIPPSQQPQLHPQQMVPIPPYANNFVRPPPPPPPPAAAHFEQQQPSPVMMFPPTPTDVWSNVAESPISAYMRYLQNSVIDSGPGQPQPNMYAQVPQNVMPQHPSPRLNGPPPALPSPRLNGPPPALPSPRLNGPHSSPPPFLPSPTSQFLLPSPTGYWNVWSPAPRSPYPLLSPGYQLPPPISPNFSFSSIGQSGILGAGPYPPSSPGYGFPLASPSGFFPISSPRWRNQ
ncbi:hypothetical protein M569_03734, partial [Genlisea aurea]